MPPSLPQMPVQYGNVPTVLPYTLPGNHSNQPVAALAFNSSPLNASVDDKIRLKIISNIYVDFGFLVRNKSSESVVITQLGDDGAPESQSLLMPGGSTKKDLNYNDWQKAFYIFATVYGQQYPGEYARALLIRASMSQM